MKAADKQFEIPASELCVSRRLHPEDIQVGDNVALSEISYQYPSFLWCGADTTVMPPDQPVRITFLPCDQPMSGASPMIVKSVCLPFVLCKLVDGQHNVYDVRQVQLTRISPRFADQVREAVRKKKKSGKKKRRKRKRGKRA